MSELILAIAMICNAHPSTPGWATTVDVIQRDQKKCVSHILSCIDYGTKGWESRTVGCLK